MTRRRRGTPKIRTTARTRRLFALLCAFVLALFVGQSALAYAAPCICEAEPSEGCCDEEGGSEDEHDDQRCPCPLPCFSSCAGHGMRAIPPALLSLDIPLPLSFEVLLIGAEHAPPRVEPGEILHVPKRARA